MYDLPHCCGVGRQILSVEIMGVDGWYMISLVAMVAGPPHPYRKKRHWERERSRGSLAARGRLNLIVVKPFSKAAFAFTMF